MNWSAIVLAAGKGERFHGTKQDVSFHGKLLWRYAYEIVSEIVGVKRTVVIGKQIPGGDTRSASVMCGLKAIPRDTDRVIIVESARPMVTKEQILELLKDPYPSSTFVRPLVNTVIMRDGTYLNRDDMYDLLTPQAFDYSMLINAYNSQRFQNMTDETRIIFEYYGIRPHFIETDNNLFKVTYPGDIEVIELIYQKQIKEGIRYE